MRHLDPERSYLELMPELASAVPEGLRDPVEDFLQVIARLTQEQPARVANQPDRECIFLPAGTVDGAKAALEEAMTALLGTDS